MFIVCGELCMVFLENVIHDLAVVVGSLLEEVLTVLSERLILGHEE